MRPTGEIHAFHNYRQSPALRHWHAVIQDTLSNRDGRAAQLLLTGDSTVEGGTATTSKRALRWVDQLTARLSSSRGGISRWIPVSTGAFNSVLTANWPGSDPPIRYSGTVAGLDQYGLGGHGVNITGGASTWIEWDFIGDFCTFWYARTTGASATPYAVTLDGAAFTGTGVPIAANGSLLKDQFVSIGTVGDYGFHTARVTVPAGVFSVSGIQTFDVTRFGLGIPSGGVITWESSRGGLQAHDFAVNAGYDTVLDAVPIDLAIISLGENDRNATPPRTPEELKGDLLTYMTRLRGRSVSNSDATQRRVGMGFILLGWWTFGDDYIDALRQVALSFGRTTVVDMRDHFDPADIALNDAAIGLGDGTHPNDRASIAIANLLHSILEPLPLRQRSQTAPVTVVESYTPATARKNWTENISLSATGTSGHIDSSGVGVTTVGERRHRLWFDAGTYAFRLVLDAAPDQGQATLWFDGTLVGALGIDGYAASPAVTSTLMGTVTVTGATAGWHYVMLRKMGTKNASSSAYGIQFRQLIIRRTTVP